jgi:hypothetical protein
VKLPVPRHLNTTITSLTACTHRLRKGCKGCVGQGFLNIEKHLAPTLRVDVTSSSSTALQKTTLEGSTADIYVRMYPCFFHHLPVTRPFANTLVLLTSRCRAMYVQTRHFNQAFTFGSGPYANSVPLKNDSGAEAHWVIGRCRTQPPTKSLFGYVSWTCHEIPFGSSLTTIVLKQNGTLSPSKASTATTVGEPGNGFSTHVFLRCLSSSKEKHLWTALCVSLNHGDQWPLI